MSKLSVWQLFLVLQAVGLLLIGGLWWSHVGDFTVFFDGTKGLRRLSRWLSSPSHWRNYTVRSLLTTVGLFAPAAITFGVAWRRGFDAKVARWVGTVEAHLPPNHLALGGRFLVWQTLGLAMVGLASWDGGPAFGEYNDGTWFGPIDGWDPGRGWWHNWIVLEHGWERWWFRSFFSTVGLVGPLAIALAVVWAKRRLAAADATLSQPDAPW